MDQRTTELMANEHARAGMTADEFDHDFRLGSSSTRGVSRKW